MTSPNPIPIFIHGAGSSADFWHEQWSAFPNGHYLDLPGHISSLGTRDQGPGTRDLDAPVTHHASRITYYAEYVAGYIQETGLRSVVLNGHSMGGAVALTLALTRPKWLAGLVLTGTGARLRVSPRLLELLRTDYPAAVEMILAESLPPLLEPLTYKQRIRLNGLRRHILRTPQQVTLGDYEACDGFDVMARVGEIRVPTLAIVGGQDRMTPAKYSQYLHREIPGSQLEVIKGAGHMLPLEQPEMYNSRVRQFLSDLIIAP